MDNYTRNSLNKLKSEGYRVTEPRKLVLGVLSRSEAPLNAYGIRNRINEEGSEVDVASVYRTLDLFERLHLIHEVGMNGAYLACHVGEHEHGPATEHVRCPRCGAITECQVPPALWNELERQMKAANRRIESATIDVRACCAECIGKE